MLYVRKMLYFIAFSLSNHVYSDDKLEGWLETFNPVIDNQTVNKYSHLPVGPKGFFLLETDKQLYLVSGNGRLAVKVDELFDVWKSQEITNVDQLNDFNRFTLKDLGINHHSLTSYIYGRGEEQVTLFVHPNSIYTRSLVSEVLSDTKLAEHYSFVFIPLSFNETTLNLSKQLYCASNPGARFNALALGDFGLLGEIKLPCNVSVIKQTMDTAARLGINKLPYIISHDGRQSFGKPPKLRAFLANK